jgi:hypothetical protein
MDRTVAETEQRAGGLFAIKAVITLVPCSKGENLYLYRSFINILFLCYVVRDSSTLLRGSSFFVLHSCSVVYLTASDQMKFLNLKRPHGQNNLDMMDSSRATTAVPSRTNPATTLKTTLQVGPLPQPQPRSRCMARRVIDDSY